MDCMDLADMLSQDSKMMLVFQSLCICGIHYNKNVKKKTLPAIHTDTDLYFGVKNNILHMNKQIRSGKFYTSYWNHINILKYWVIQ